MTNWVRARLAAVIDYLDRISREDDLVPGAAYVWLAQGPCPCLAVAELVSLDAWVEPAHMPGEALSQGFSFAVLEDASGLRRTVARREVLWPVSDHAAIVAAARTLGIPVVPASLRGGPTWRLGGVRLERSDMVDLGQLVRS